VLSTEFVKEESPNTLKGSFTDDLILSKIWLAKTLKKILGEKCARTIYILGSWYGNRAFILAQQKILFDKIVLVETDQQSLDISEKLLRIDFDPGILVFLHTDAKDMIYDDPGVVINTSINDMPLDWYQNLPDGMPVIIQGRDNLGTVDTMIADMEQFDDMFPMSSVIYLGKKELEDPEKEYTRYMKIGVK
jgi:hypothetical protein